MRALIIAALIAFSASLTAQNSRVSVINDSKDTVTFFADLMYTTPSYTYFKIQDTIYKLESSRFINTTGYKKLPDMSYEQLMLEAFNHESTAFGLSLTGAGIGAISFLFIAGDSPVPALFNGGIVVASAFGLAAYFCHIAYVVKGKRAMQMAVAIPYKLP